MSLFDGTNLFASGPHRFHIGGLSLRQAIGETPGSRGVRLTGQGQHAREITQHGDLLADDAASMLALTQAIEAKLDGLAYDLIDDLGKVWPGVVMLGFKPEPITRAGPRYR